MKREKEIWLDPEEIQQLLEGGLYWNDIEQKSFPDGAESLRSTIEEDGTDIQGIIREAPSIRNIIMESSSTDIVTKQPVEEEDVRAILLGEGRSQLKEYQPEVQAPLEQSNSLYKDRQIDFSHIQEDIQRPFMAHAVATQEEDGFQVEEKEPLLGLDDQEDSPSETSNDLACGESFSLNDDQEAEVGSDEKISFTNLSGRQSEQSMTKDNEIKDIILSSEIEPVEERPSFGGFKLVFLIAIVAATVFGLWVWYYYFCN